MENFYKIHECLVYKLRVYLCASNSELNKKWNEINRDKKLTEKFVLIIEAIKMKTENRTQYNREFEVSGRIIYAIKVDSHRFYTLSTTSNNFRELFICRYGKKQSQKNDKKLTTIIESIGKIEIQKILANE